MAAITVDDPNGTAWTVRRRWVPHRERRGVRDRWRRRPDTDGLSDGLTVAGDFAEIPVVGIVAAVIGGLLFVVLMAIWLPFAVLLVIDLVWLAVVLVGGAFARVVFRRPWRVEARSPEEIRVWHVRGYRAAGEQRDAIARQLQHGHNPLGETPPPLAH